MTTHDRDNRPLWTCDGCDPGVWIMSSRSTVWACIKPHRRGGYRIHWFGVGRMDKHHWMHGRGSPVFGMANAMRHAAAKAGYSKGAFLFPDLGIDWDAVGILEHAIGHWTGPTANNPIPYRNVYCADAGFESWDRCMALAGHGLMQRRVGEYFSVTPLAFDALNLPRPKDMP